MRYTAFESGQYPAEAPVKERFYEAWVYPRANKGGTAVYIAP